MVMTLETKPLPLPFPARMPSSRDVMGDAGIHIIESTDTDQLTFAAAVLDLALLHEAFLKLHFPVLLGRSGEEDHLSVQLVRDLRICQRQHGTHHTGQLCVMPAAVGRAVSGTA